MVIDIHAHCFADNVADKAMPQLEAHCGVKAIHDGTLAGLTRHMALAGVDISVVQPVATKPSQVSIINTWAKQNRSQSLWFFGALHPDDPDFYAAAQQLKADGFMGVKLHPDYQGFFADEARLMPMYDALADLGLIVLMHAGVDIGFPWPVHCTPLMIKNIITQVPRLTLIAAHMGSHGLWRDVEQLLIGENVYLDTSYSWYYLKNARMTDMIQKHGAQKVLFGTDSPWKSAAEEIDHIASLSLPSSDIDQILYRNAMTLLKI
jgi:predicted TIM-barrel fold metal-dependent hydrolase